MTAPTTTPARTARPVLRPLVARPENLQASALGVGDERDAWEAHPIESPFDVAIAATSCGALAVALVQLLFLGAVTWHPAALACVCAAALARPRRAA